MQRGGFDHAVQNGKGSPFSLGCAGQSRPTSGDNDIEAKDARFGAVGKNVKDFLQLVFPSARREQGDSLFDFTDGDGAQKAFILMLLQPRENGSLRRRFHHF